MFAVEDLKEVLGRLQDRGAELVGEAFNTKIYTCSVTFVVLKA
jgi:hypothetical protein